MLKLLAALTPLAAVAAISSAASAQVGPPPGSVYVEQARMTGEGCPEGTSAVNIAPDAGAFTVLFGAYVATAGAGTGTVADRKSCAINLILHVPQGWTFALTAVDFRGFADLTQWARGQEQSLVAYPPRSIYTRLATLDLAGPIRTDYLHHIDTPARNRIYAPCLGASRNLLLNTTMGVSTQRNATALMTVDSVDGVVTHRYALSWRPCGA